MSDLQELFESEGVDDADDLLSWATQRASSLLDELGDDPELSALLVDGGTAGEPTPLRSTQLPGGETPHADEVTQPRARVRTEPAPLPPIPSKARASAPPDAQDDEEEIEEMDIEELDVEELELIEDDDDEGAPEADAAPAENGGDEQPPAPAQSFGPPDGTDEVPEWKAALMSAQTDDEQAAAQVKEASSAEPLPEAPADEEPRGLAGRLEAEDDEISQHSMDFSDLDTDDE